MSGTGETNGGSPNGRSPNGTGRSVDGGVFMLFMGTAAIALIALLVGVIGLFSPPSGDGGSSVSATGETQTVAVELGEMYMEPSSIEVPAGTELVLEVTNAGEMPHDLVLGDDLGTALLEPGDSETLVVGVVEESTMAWCSVPGHREAGMEMEIAVTGDGGATDTETASHSADGDPGGSGGGDHAEIDPNAEPEAGWKTRDPNLPPAPGQTVHEVTWPMTDLLTEVAPGVEQLLWAFDDQVPGPTLRGKVGDIFRVTIVNETEIDHSIDFHASKVAWDDEMRDVGPGEELVYEFEATASGIFMYHCGTAPTLHHIGNGMYGAVVIDPPDLPEVDHEFIMLQSEFYLGAEGEVGDLAKMQEDEWDAVVFNGFFQQYKFSPIEVGTGERIRVWVLDVGPNENSSFHIVGTIFDTVYKEGAYLLRPGPEQGGSQALDLQPAQGGFVEFTFAEDGLYPMVTHKFSNVGKGALGLFASGDVEVGEVSE